MKAIVSSFLSPFLLSILFPSFSRFVLIFLFFPFCFLVFSPLSSLFSVLFLSYFFSFSVRLNNPFSLFISTDSTTLLFFYTSHSLMSKMKYKKMMITSSFYDWQEMILSSGSFPNRETNVKKQTHFKIQFL